MLRQLIYRSRATAPMADEDIRKIVDDSLPFNTTHDITGLLLFDGEFFFQVLEGASDSILSLFEHLKSDARHTNVIKVLDTTISQREFGKWSLKPFVFNHRNNCYWLPSDLNIRRDSRAFFLLNSFATGQWRNCVSAEYRSKLKRTLFIEERVVDAFPNSEIQFAFQPIVDIKNGVVSSLEALLRTPDGTFPDVFLSSLPESERYVFDLKSKAVAIAQGAKLLEPGQALSINLLPGAITHTSNVAEQLIRYVEAVKLVPEQLIVEVTENEMVMESDAFYSALDSLRSSGIRLALDDFGAGYAGLSLLADFMPDKIKLDRAITRGIHENGPRQAILQAVFEFAKATGSHLIVEGVESFEEWLWLYNAGVQKFQGFLFAKPKLNGVNAINFDASTFLSIDENDL